MHFSTAFITLAAPFLVAAAPVRFLERRAAIDVTVMRFADVLEQAESQLYAQALAKFQESDFTAAGFANANLVIEQMKVIQEDEATHSTILQGALRSFGAEPLTSCKFNFDPILVDVSTLVSAARVIEAVGVGAYMGAAGLLSDPRLLNAAASIMTIEARHGTMLNIISGTGSSVPNVVDMGYKPQEVIAMVAPFLDGPCDLGLPANPSLSITNTGTVAPGTALTFSSTAINGTIPESSLFCQMMVGGMSTSISLPFNACVVPEGINGPVAVYITSDDQPLAANVVDRATSQLVAGPTLAVIDTEPQALGQLVRPSSASGSSSSSGSSDSAPDSSTTRTISPSEASAIIAGASATPSDSADAAATPTDSADAAATPTASDSAPTASSTDGAPASNAGSGTGPAVPGTPNDFQGKSPDGKLTVNGWTMVPA